MSVQSEWQGIKRCCPTVQQLGVVVVGGVLVVMVAVDCSCCGGCSSFTYGICGYCFRTVMVT